jgi:hypothetical protein
MIRSLQAVLEVAGTMWSLSNAFTSAFKELDPIPQFQATAKAGSILRSGNHNVSRESEAG